MPAVSPQVLLVSHTPGAEALVAGAARLCYASEPAAAAPSEEEETARFIRKLRGLGHLSPFEHAVFTFRIEGVSRAMTHQLVRHRLASYSQRSQRYVRHRDFDYVVPPRLEGCEVEAGDGRRMPAPEYFAETMHMLAERYARLAAALTAAGGGDEAGNEDARYLLPNACETKILMTMNARELLHFLEERLCERAQWEIRRVAEAMLGQLQAVCPALFEYAGPKCIRLGRCPEGKLSCGHFEAVRARYAPRRAGAAG